MLSLIFFITLALVRFVKLMTPSSLLTDSQVIAHRQRNLIWIVLSIGIGCLLALIEFSYF